MADLDLMVAVGGDGTVLSAAHFLDHGTIPLLGINSDPNVSVEDRKVTKKVVDERRLVLFLKKATEIMSLNGSIFLVIDFLTPQLLDRDLVYYAKIKNPKTDPMVHYVCVQHPTSKVVYRKYCMVKPKTTCNVGQEFDAKSNQHFPKQD